MLVHAIVDDVAAVQRHGLQDRGNRFTWGDVKTGVVCRETAPDDGKSVPVTIPEWLWERYVLQGSDVAVFPATTVDRLRVGSKEQGEPVRTKSYGGATSDDSPGELRRAAADLMQTDHPGLDDDTIATMIESLLRRAQRAEGQR
jgi:hypothetical protein